VARGLEMAVSSLIQDRRPYLTQRQASQGQLSHHIVEGQELDGKSLCQVRMVCD
jgi:hypothetical protein